MRAVILATKSTGEIIREEFAALGQARIRFLELQFDALYFDGFLVVDLPTPHIDSAFDRWYDLCLNNIITLALEVIEP